MLTFIIKFQQWYPITFKLTLTVKWRFSLDKDFRHPKANCTFEIFSTQKYNVFWSYHIRFGFRIYFHNYCMACVLYFNFYNLCYLLSPSNFSSNSPGRAARPRLANEPLKNVGRPCNEWVGIYFVVYSTLPRWRHETCTSTCTCTCTCTHTYTSIHTPLKCMARHTLICRRKLHTQHTYQYPIPNIYVHTYSNKQICADMRSYFFFIFIYIYVTQP